jgi:hypothetical protein
MTTEHRSGALESPAELRVLEVSAATRARPRLQLVPDDVVMDVSEQRASREALADARTASITEQDWDRFPAVPGRVRRHGPRDQRRVLAVRN